MVALMKGIPSPNLVTIALDVSRCANSNACSNCALLEKDNCMARHVAPTRRWASARESCPTGADALRRRAASGTWQTSYNSTNHLIRSSSDGLSFQIKGLPLPSDLPKDDL